MQPLLMGEDSGHNACIPEVGLPENHQNPARFPQVSALELTDHP